LDTGMAAEVAATVAVAGALAGVAGCAGAGTGQFKAATRVAKVAKRVAGAEVVAVSGRDNMQMLSSRGVTTAHRWCATASPVGQT